VSVAVNGTTQATTSFTIISTAVSGKGINGTLTAAGPVAQGELLPLNAAITDNGNAPLTDAPFAINIASSTVPFIASVPLGGSTAVTLTYATASLAPGAYTATLVSLITQQPLALATAAFNVTAPATQPTLTIVAGSTARVLIWSPCKSNNNSTCTPP